jgi:hypothetical protein
MRTEMFDGGVISRVETALWSMTFVLLMLGFLYAEAPAQVQQQYIQLSREAEDAPGVKTRNLRAQVIDSSAGEYRPHLVLQAWGDECRMSIDLLSGMDQSAGAPEVGIFNDAVCWQLNEQKISHAIYRTATGDLEWEIRLKQKPQSNRFEFPVKTYGLEFLYQDTVCHLPGCYRPAHVKGSYAVYHATRKGNASRFAADEIISEYYGCGKAFHIYRLLCRDADNDSTWCSIEIDVERGYLVMIVPADFIESAAYPVTIDPTFGYTSKPATRVQLSSSYAVMVNTHEASSGDVITSYSAYCADLSGDDATGAVIAYSVTDGLPNGRIASPVSLPPVSGAVGKWYQTTTVSHTMTSGNEYCVAIGDYANGLCCYYDSGSGIGYSRSTTGLADPWNSVGTGPQRFGVYATYTEGTGGGSKGRRRRILAGGER